MNWPQLGFGVGLRAEHYDEILNGPRQVDWFEAISENYFDTRGRPMTILETVRRDYPLALHGVALSIGSTDPLDASYLAQLRQLIDIIQPALVTDHLCWTGVRGRPLYDLLPLPYTEEALVHVVARIARVQDTLASRIALENPSSYITYRDSTMSESEFLVAVTTAADCGILLDVNNVYVTARNHGFDPIEYLDAIPPQRVPNFISPASPTWAPTSSTPQRPGSCRRLGALPLRRRPLRRGLYAGGVGCRHSPVRSAVRRKRAGALHRARGQ